MLARLRALALEWDHVERQVRPVEARAHDERIAKTQPRADLLGHLLGRGRGARHHDGRAQPVDHSAQAQVVGPEVMAPLGHAVGLVDDEEIDRPRLERGQEDWRREPLGRAEHDPRLAAAHCVQCGRDRPLVHSRRDHRRGVAAEQQPAVLVCHQRDQGRDDDGQLLRRDAGQLVAEALPPAGGHHDEAVAPLERGLDRLALAGAERVVPKVREQRIRIAGAVVGPRGPRLDRDPIEAPERHLGVALVVAQPAAGGRERLRCTGGIGASRLVQRAPERPQLLQLPVHRGGAVGLDALRQRQRARAKVVHGTQTTGARGSAERGRVVLLAGFRLVPLHPLLRQGVGLALERRLRYVEIRGWFDADEGESLA